MDSTKKAIMHGIFVSSRVRTSMFLSPSSSEDAVDSSPLAFANSDNDHEGSSGCLFYIKLIDPGRLCSRVV